MRSIIASRLFIGSKGVVLSYFLALFYKILCATFAFSFVNKELTMAVSVELFEISTPLEFLNS